MLQKLWIPELLQLFFPNNCLACSQALVQQEETICLACNYKLPRTSFHVHHENPISRVFWGRVNLEAATSFLFFNKGGHVQQLIHHLKYRGNKNAGFYLGKLFGIALMNNSAYKNADLIIPVPLHPKKQYQRGFNQSSIIAEGMSETMKKPVVDNKLIRLVHTPSQTKKSRYKRWENVKDVFGIKHPDELVGKHILLVDDVLTTGATLESCAQKLLKIKETKVSVVTLAYAQV